MNKIQVVAAIIRNENRFLCVQRSASKYDYISKKFEFPGGKIEAGESEESALKREIFEELSLAIDIREKLIIINHEYPDFEIVMHCFMCYSVSQNITLHEHIDSKWLEVEKMSELDWAAADIPIVKFLEKLYL
jgi:8-oxo-dGTP diphosphatase